MCFLPFFELRRVSVAFCAMLVTMPVDAIAKPAAAFTVAATTATAKPKSTARTLYERQDHRMLPVGTKIYYGARGAGGAMTYVFPGKPVPPAYAHKAPDVIVVSASDPRGADEVQRLKRPAVCCPTKH